MLDDTFSDAEIQAVAQRALESATPDGLVDAQLDAIIGWAHRAKVNYILLQLFLAGEIDGQWLDDDMHFRQSKAGGECEV